MPLKDVLSLTNIMFVVAGIYFAVAAVLQEGTIYSSIATILCFVSAGVAVKKDWFFAGPWRVATSVFALVLMAAQVIVNYQTLNPSSPNVMASTVINAVLFVVFLGVLLSVLREVTKRKSAEEEEEVESKAEKSKKLTYEI